MPQLEEASYLAGTETEFDRLMAAATVSQELCQLLLTQPSLAIAVDYEGEKFNFSPDERQIVLSIRARTLEEFAEQLVRQLNTSN